MEAIAIGLEASATSNGTKNTKFIIIVGTCADLVDLSFFFVLHTPTAVFIFFL